MNDPLTTTSTTTPPLSDRSGVTDAVAAGAGFGMLASREIARTRRQIRPRFPR